MTQTFLRMTAQLREDFSIPYHDFGPANAGLNLAVVGGLHGNELNGIFVLSRLAECKKRAGDIKGAIAELREAADSTDPDEAEPMYRELAELARGPGGDLEVAALAFTRLLERDPTDADNPVIVPCSVVPAELYLETEQSISLDPIAQQNRQCILMPTAIRFRFLQQVESADKMPGC